MDVIGLPILMFISKCVFPARKQNTECLNKQSKICKAFQWYFEKKKHLPTPPFTPTTPNHYKHHHHSHHHHGRTRCRCHFITTVILIIYFLYITRQSCSLVHPISDQRSKEQHSSPHGKAVNSRQQQRIRGYNHQKQPHPELPHSVSLRG